MEILISGASTGIGKACAVHLAHTGHSVWAGVRTAKNFEDVQRLNVQGLKPVYLDVTDEASVRECLSSITKSSGMLHGLVNNAGIAVGGPIEALPMEEWRRQFEINFFGAIRLMQASLPLLRQCKGRIVNMSSLSGRVAFPYMGAYAASKYALEAVSDSLRREMLRHGVKIAVVEPGAIATPIWEKAKSEGLGTTSKFTPEMAELYGRDLASFAKRVEQTAQNAAPVSVVIKAVEHALLARRPRTRYPVGKGIKATALLLNVLPDEWVDRFMR